MCCALQESLARRMAAAAQKTPIQHLRWEDFLSDTGLFDFLHQKNEFTVILRYIQELLPAMHSTVQASNGRRIPKKFHGKPCHVVYAPRGRGKTTLLTEMAKWLSGRQVFERVQARFSAQTLIAIFCSFRAPDQSMGCLLERIQSELPVNHAGRMALTIEELRIALDDSGHIVAVFVDDVELLYSKSASRVASLCRVEEKLLAAAVDSAKTVGLERRWSDAETADVASSKRASILAQIDADPDFCGKQLAQQWLFQLQQVAVPPNRSAPWRVLAVLCASQASSRRLLYQQVRDGETQILNKYPLYNAVKTDLNSGKFTMSICMTSGCWENKEKNPCWTF